MTAGGQRIAIDQHQVRGLADAQRSGFILDSEHACRIDRVRAQQHLHRQGPAGHLRGDAPELVLRQREHHRDGVDLAHQHDAVDVARAHHVADVHLPQPGDAVDGRGDAREVEVEPRRRHLGLVGAQRGLRLLEGAERGVDLRLGADLLREQGAGPVERAAAAGDERPVARGDGLGLAYGDGEGPRVDLREHVAAAHRLALGEAHGVEAALHPGAHGDGVVRGDGAEALEVERHVALLDRDHEHRHRAVARGGGVPGARRPPLLGAGAVAQREHERREAERPEEHDAPSPLRHA